MPNWPIIEGKILTLNPLDECHINDMHEYSSNPLFFDNMEMSPHQDISDTWAYFNKLKKRELERNSVYWAIINKEDQRMIGTFGIVDIDDQSKTGSIGYGLNPDYWGKGFFREALHLSMNFAIGVRELEQIIAITSVANEASIRGLKREGFRENKIFKELYSINGIRQDAVQLILTLEQWEKQKVFPKIILLQK